MAFAIQTLPIDAVHLMAAGEVIDSLASVVRELVENALDAEATRITISIWMEQWRVRVADNGVGISLENLQLAALPHSTSKIRGSADLARICTLGFRGEALHSLAQLANLDILSRPATADAGWQILYNSTGDPEQIDPVAIAPGTVVTADQIFGNWLTRRQGLPAIAQQLRAIQATIHQFALCHPHVTWQVQQDERDWFSLFPADTARGILPQILRDVQWNDLQELTRSIPSSSSTAPASLDLLLGLPDRSHRHRPDWVRVALNGRMIQMPELEQTILTSFRRTLPRDRFPICLVHLHVPADAIDWNRHPAKTEVYLHQLQDWRDQVADAIAEALCLSSAKLPQTFYSQRVGKLLKTAEAEQGYSVGESPATDAAPKSTTCLRAIAQVHNRYILAEHPAGVWLIEQHIAHERVLYEQLCDRWQIVLLESPIILNQLTLTQVQQLQRLGCEVEAFGEQVWMIRTAPELLAQRKDCPEALLELSLGGDLQTAQVATACRSAIRNGTPMTMSAMQTLLDQWQQTRNPRTCPHGRPICLTLEESALARFFRRHWMIGKSHGI
jgi:DNA mismatch repair protein MutL